MKKILLIALFLSIGLSQRNKINEIISERHQNGLKKLVLVFEGTGINETLKGKYGFYDNGIKEFIELYNNNKRHGKSIFWDEEGNIIVEGTYNLGKMDGLWIYYHNNGNKLGEGSYKNGDGTDIQYYNVIPRNGMVGKWAFYYVTGQKEVEGYYKNGIENGIFTFWFEKGQKNSVRNIKDGISHGLLTEWYENGQKKQEVTYNRGDLEGLGTYWYENGKKESKGFYKDDKKDGLWIYWRENGDKDYEKTYVGGNLDKSVKQINQITLTTFIDSTSYALGADLGLNLKRQNVDINYDVFMAGVVDGMEIPEFVKLDQKQRREVMSLLQKEIREKGKVDSDSNLKIADEFLAKNKQGNPEVKETPTGLQYRVIKEGEGDSPSPTDRVKVHYAGRLVDGTEFDSSYERGEPSEFGLNQVIKGWTEGLQLMKVGSKYEFFIHPKIAYGSRPRPTIPANSVLIFEVELLDIIK